MLVINKSDINKSVINREINVYRSFSSDVTAAILVYQNNEMAAILVYGTGISSFLFKYFVLFHHPTGATDHVSENDLLSSDYWAYINWGTYIRGAYIRVGLYSGGLIFGMM